MKKITSLLFILILINSKSFTQTDSTITYQNLPTIKLYSPSLTPPDTCCPCILQFYDENKILFKEQVYCMKYEVGWVKEYYPNGNLKVSGQYLENHSGNWYHLIETGKCCFQTGKWTYFDENGDTLYHEYWQNGFFIEQIPEQSKAEIYYIDLNIDGEHLPHFSMISFQQLKTLEIFPLYKNSHRDNIDLSINFIIISPEQNVFSFSFTPENFKNINVLELLKKTGIPPEDYSMDEFLIDLYPGDIDTNYKIQILNNGIVIAEIDIFLYP